MLPEQYIRHFDISFAPSAADRIAELQAGNPRKLVWCRTVVTSNGPSDEAYLHERHVDGHIHSKWFAMTKAEADEAADHLIDNRDGCW